MGRMYTVTFDTSIVNGDQDLFEITAAAGVSVRIHSVEFNQQEFVGDASEEQLHLRMVYGTGATSGSGGTTPGENPNPMGGLAAVTVVEANNTTVMTAGGGSITTLLNWDWNIRIPFEKIWTPEMRPVLPAGDIMTFEMVDGPAVTTDNVHGNLYFEEIGT